MIYDRIKQGVFHERPNRFIAIVEIDGKLEKCHVKNTGRCKELLIPGVTVYLQEASNPDRKTKYDLISVKKHAKIRLSIKDIFIKPFISAVGMAIVVFLGYSFLMNIIGGKLATIVAVFIGVIIYGILLIVTGAITSEDLSLLPRGKRLGEKLERFKLIK